MIYLHKSNRLNASQLLHNSQDVLLLKATMKQINHNSFGSAVHLKTNKQKKNSISELRLHNISLLYCYGGMNMCNMNMQRPYCAALIKVDWMLANQSNPGILQLATICSLSWGIPRHSHDRQGILYNPFH